MNIPLVALTAVKVSWELGRIAYDILDGDKKYLVKIPKNILEWMDYKGFHTEKVNFALKPVKILSKGFVFGNLWNQLGIFHKEERFSFPNRRDWGDFVHDGMDGAMWFHDCEIVHFNKGLEGGIKGVGAAGAILGAGDRVVSWGGEMLKDSVVTPLFKTRIFNIVTLGRAQFWAKDLQKSAPKPFRFEDLFGCIKNVHIIALSIFGLFDARGICQGKIFIWNRPRLILSSSMILFGLLQDIFHLHRTWGLSST